MNSVFCAVSLLLISDPDNWNECVLGHQTSRNLCICQKPNPSHYKCFRKQLCQVSRFPRFPSCNPSPFPPD